MRYITFRTYSKQGRGALDNGVDRDSRAGNIFDKSDARTTDDELQYKAALTVGNLASNAVKLLPGNVSGGGGDIGTAATSLLDAKTKTAARSGKKQTEAYLDRADQEAVR